MVSIPCRVMWVSGQTRLSIDTFQAWISLNPLSGDVGLRSPATITLSDLRAWSLNPLSGDVGLRSFAEYCEEAERQGCLNPLSGDVGLRSCANSWAKRKARSLCLNPLSGDVGLRSLGYEGTIDALLVASESPVG